MIGAFSKHFSKAEMEAIRAAARGEAGAEAARDAEEMAAQSDWRRDFLAKLKRVGRHLPFAEDLLAAYYCTIDPATPSRVKLVLLAAIAYFIMPFDAVTDLLPLLGYADDAAVIAAAIAQVAGSITEDHRRKASKTLRDET
jgi:uncharacterized membrane protein YkvA (DUF1232 family)